MRNLFQKTFLVTWIGIGALCGELRAEVAAYVQINLVSDIPGLATITEPELVNPWGVSHTTTSPFWTSNQGTNTATLYRRYRQDERHQGDDGQPADRQHCDPDDRDRTARTDRPGQQYQHCGLSGRGNGGDGSSAHFIFANLNGTISAWDNGSDGLHPGHDPRAPSTPGWRSTGHETRLYAAKPRGPAASTSSTAPLTRCASAGRIRQPRAAQRARSVQRAGHRRQHLRDLCACRAPGRNQRPLGAGAVAIFDEDGNFIRN